MKKIFNLALLTVQLLLFAQSVNAQRWARIYDSPVTVYNFTETVNTAPEIVNIFYNTQGEHFRDPLAPRFILTDREGQWGLGIGGYLMGRAEVDFDKVVDNVDFMPSQIQRGSGASSQYQMDITTSTLFLKLVGRSRMLGDFQLFTSADWRGNGKNLRLLNAYLRTKHVTLGYTTGNFMDLAAYPATVDYAGPCGMTFYRTTQLALNFNLFKGMTMGVAVESPGVSAASDAFANVGTQTFPNIPIYFKYELFDDSHVRVGGILRDMSYRNLISGGRRQKIAWGAQASTLMTFGKFQVSGQYSIGEGIGSLVNNISNEGVDLVPVPDNNGQMMMLLSDAWFAALHYNISNSTFVSATYSQTNLYSRRGYAGENPDKYKRGQYLAVNMFTMASDNLQLGVEYLHGWRVDFDEHTYNANRINISARYNF